MKKITQEDLDKVLNSPFRNELHNEFHNILVQKYEPFIKIAKKYADFCPICQYEETERKTQKEWLHSKIKSFVESFKEIYPLKEKGVKKT